MNRTTLACRIAVLSVAVVLTCGWLRTTAAAEEKTPPAKPESMAAPATEETKTPTAESELPKTAKLRFQFRYQPWKDVLEWFARKANLTLQMESTPPGTFNYRDEHEYTPAEAIDFLNGILIRKGYALVRWERFLMVVNLESANPPSVFAPRDSSQTEAKTFATQDASLVTIYRLKHVDPQAALAVLHALFPDDRTVRLVVDPQVPGLIVMGPREAHKKVQETLTGLDVPAEAAGEKQIKIFHIINAEPASFEKILAKILPKEVQVAIDEQARSLVLSGSPSALSIAEAICQGLDEEAGNRDRPKRSASYELRVVWLASGLAGDEKGQAPGEDLKDVVAELSRLGVKTPRQIGQMVVRNASAGGFQIKCAPVFNGNPADFNASGMLLQQLDRTLTLQIAIKTAGVLAGNSGDLNEITTQIVVPLKQYVVLATAPVGSVTSIFVVQVTQK